MATKNDVIAEIARRGKLKKEVVGKVIDEMFAYMTDALGRGEAVNFMGYFSLKPVYKPEYTARNPQTGNPVQVPGKYRIQAKAGRYFSDAVNKIK